MTALHPELESRDLSGSPLYTEVQDHFRSALEPGFGRVTTAADLTAAGEQIAFTGTSMRSLSAQPESVICVADRRTGHIRRLSSGPADRLPRFSPDGSRLAFLSDRSGAGQHGVALSSSASFGEPVHVTLPGATAEALSWSPDGSRLVAIAAELGADRAGAMGSGTFEAKTDAPTWLPDLRTGTAQGWRRLWMIDPASGRATRLSPDGLNVWEAACAGTEDVVAVVSDGPTENDWYGARLVRLRPTGQVEELVRGRHQLGGPAASPSGAGLCVIHGLCSDRGVLAGELLIVGGEVARAVETSFDTSWAAWIDESRLMAAGLDGLDTVLAEIDATRGSARELWRSRSTFGGYYPEAALLEGGRVAVALESYTAPPAIHEIGADGSRQIASFHHAGHDYLQSVGGEVDAVEWEGERGLSIQGLLVRPAVAGRVPLAVHAHGGPVWAWRERWSMGGPFAPLLAQRGWAILHPNPRGSGGRGIPFAEEVLGDMGGADGRDVLAGVEHVISTGVTDPNRVGIFGSSYGGYLSAWLVTQTERFAASVPMAPATDRYSSYFTSNVSAYVRRFLDDDPLRPASRFFDRSPVMHASSVRTPTMLTTGAADRCTPPSQALEFYRALRARDVPTALVTYPEEGHGVRRFPAVIDHVTRLVGWFERHAATRTMSGPPPR